MANKDDSDLDSLSGGGFDDSPDSAFEDFAPEKQTLADAWRSNPVLKLGAILGVIGVVIFAIALFGGKSESPKGSAVGVGSGLKEPPAAGILSETMRAATEEYNIQQVEDARRTGGSALPVPIEPARGRIAPADSEVSPEDPFMRWRKLQEDRARQQAGSAQQETGANGQDRADPRAAAANALSNLMVTQMGSVLQNQSIQNLKFIEITPTSWINELLSDQDGTSDSVSGTSVSETPVSEEEILVPAGTIEYAQLITEANSDIPGPVLAQIVTGPLAGSRIIGSFTPTESFLTLTFSTVVLDGVSVSINTVALDPDTTLPGIVTEIDRRYFRRVVLPMAAAFVEGLATAVSESGRTTVTIVGGGSTVTGETNPTEDRQEVALGISEASGVLREILEEEGGKDVPMIRVARGTPMGILFLNPVTRDAR